MMKKSSKNLKKKLGKEFEKRLRELILKSLKDFGYGYSEEYKIKKSLELERDIGSLINQFIGDEDVEQNN